MAEIIPIDPKWDHLTQEAVRATNMGMTYGKYKAMQYERCQRHIIAEQAPTTEQPEQPVKKATSYNVKLRGQEDKIFALLTNGHTLGTIAARFGVSRTTVRTYCKNIGGELWEQYCKAARAGRKKALSLAEQPADRGRYRNDRIH